MFGTRSESRFTSCANKAMENFCIKINNKQQSVAAASVAVIVSFFSPAHPLHYTTLLSSSTVASVLGSIIMIMLIIIVYIAELVDNHSEEPSSRRRVHQHHITCVIVIPSGMKSSWKTFYMNKLCLFLCINFPFFCVRILPFPLWDGEVWLQNCYYHSVNSYQGRKSFTISLFVQNSWSLGWSSLLLATIRPWQTCER